MFEKEHEFDTIDGSHVTVTLKNTMRQDVRHNVMAHKFASQDDHPADWNIRSDFCWFISRVVDVDGTDWQPVDETATDDEFDACYHAFTDLVTDDGFYGCVRAVNAMKRRTDPIEKPDAALTDEEQSDPN